MAWGVYRDDVVSPPAETCVERLARPGGQCVPAGGSLCDCNGTTAERLRRRHTPRDGWRFERHGSDYYTAGGSDSGCATRLVWCHCWWTNGGNGALHAGPRTSLRCLGSYAQDSDP